MSVGHIAEVTPLCPHFGSCGGCQLQHLAYPTQLALKRDRLRTLLREAGVLITSPIEIHSADPWHYRNRIRLRLERANGVVSIGYSRAASTDFLPIHTCPIAAPILLHAAQTLVALAQQSSTIAHWLVATAELELFTTPDESRLQLTLLLAHPPDIPADGIARTFSHLCESLRQQLPQLSGAGADLLRGIHANAPRPRANRRAAATFTAPTWGSPGLLYPLALNGQFEKLWVSRGSFFQINRHLLETLVTIATLPQQRSSSLQDLAWDLFAGVGLFTRALAPYAHRITAVETAPASTADLAAARLPNTRIFTSTVLDFLRVAALDRDRPDLVLLDPPRAGLGLEAATLLARLKPASIVYVSCDPVTLARDLAAMLSSGYNLAELHLVDMFPQTSHQETVAILHRNTDRTSSAQG